VLQLCCAHTAAGRRLAAPAHIPHPLCTAKTGRKAATACVCTAKISGVFSTREGNMLTIVHCTCACSVASSWCEASKEASNLLPQAPPTDLRKQVSLGDGVFVCGDWRDTATCDVEQCGTTTNVVCSKHTTFVRPAVCRVSMMCSSASHLPSFRASAHAESQMR
jgi:hypothetical protein